MRLSGAGVPSATDEAVAWRSVRGAGEEEEERDESEGDEDGYPSSWWDDGDE